MKSRQERVKLAEKMFLQGASRQVIAKELGVKPDTVSVYLKGAFKPKVTNEMLVEMMRLYKELGSWVKVAERLGTVKQVITYWRKLAKERNLETNNSNKETP